MRFRKDIPFVGTTQGLDGELVLLGLPYDGSETFRKGTKTGPSSAREYSDSIESFSPDFEKDITDYPVSDAGSVMFKSGAKKKVLAEIGRAAAYMMEQGKKAVYLGGEHLVTFPLVKKYHEKYPDLKVLYFDAHADSRDAYGGDPLSHSAVVHLMADFIRPKDIFMFGIRSFEKKEFDWLKARKIQVDREMKNLPSVIGKVKKSPVYITIDMDVFDPGVMNGVGNPEAGGISFKDFTLIAREFTKLKNVVAADVVELAPQYDASGASSIFTAKVIRELILSLVV
jgi:agmatinase